MVHSFFSFLDIYIYIENGEFHTKLFDKRDNFGFDIVGCHVTAPMPLAKCCRMSFVEFLEQPVKLKIFFLLENIC